MTAYNALIRTHHITSQKKIAKLRHAASSLDLHVLLRTGGCPGIMYAEGPQAGVETWVETVKRLRYKDFQLVSRPAAMQVPISELSRDSPSMHILDSVKDFAHAMQNRGIHDWWRQRMGFVPPAP